MASTSSALAAITNAAAQSPTSINTLLNRSQGNQNPLLNFKWICTSLPFGYDVTYVESLDLPFSNIAIGEGWMGAGSYTYFPDFSNISSFSLTLYEDTAMSTLQWLTFWKNQVCAIYPGVSGATTANNAVNAYSLPSAYKRNMEFKLLGTDNSVSLTVTLIGTWPSDTSNLALDYSSSERIKISQQFSCDGQSLVFAKPIAAISGSGSAQAAPNPAAAISSSQQQLLETSQQFLGTALPSGTALPGGVSILGSLPLSLY